VEDVKDRILNLAGKITSKEVTVSINTADDYEANRFYLTVTGLSAENGDDGQVGRGNRVSGLITPFRPMSLEAAAGKNPISHVGKIYNIAAQEIVNELVSEVKGIEEAYCYMLSQIGNPINKPKAIHIEVKGAGVSEDKVRRAAEPITESVLEKLPKIWKDFLERKYEIF
jgi:S-adenosylmethionine synthetase